jgi:ketosteroid isomerase-like protein
MSEQDNVALLERGFKAFNTGDVATLTEIIDANAVQHMPGSSKFSGDFKGRDNILAMYGGMGEATNGTFQAPPEAITADGPDKVKAKYRAKGERNGKKLDSPRTIVFTIRDGKIVDIDDRDDNVAAFDAFFA